MFTGIITDIGKVLELEQRGDLRARIGTGYDIGGIDIGASIACNGVCLTVVKTDGKVYDVTAIHETMIVSNLKNLKIGDIVNLERCMLPNTRLDGHMVQGHVDDTTKCMSIEEVDGSWYFQFALSKANQGMIVPKGSVAINGTSLTVVAPNENSLMMEIQ